MQSMPSTSGPIEHIVVLMMENRSFDHMLGYLPREGHLQNFEGLTDTEIKPAELGGPTSEKFFNLQDPTVPTSAKFSVCRGAPYKMEVFVRGVGPPHDFPDVNFQLNNTKDGPSAMLPATNNGFVRAWADSLRRFGVEPRTAELQRVMECFTPEQLPVLSTLAREFVLCDHWFCSVPGPTMPNRLYVHAATSCGYAHNAFGTKLSCRTIYNSLSEAGYTWNVYHQNMDVVMDFTQLHYNESNNPNASSFRDYASFKDDIENGKLAHYNFINPLFISHWSNLTQDVELATSQHAPCDVRPGEQLIAEVYNALRSNKSVWEKTLLVILYDEHGGFYDHVPPPTGVPNPDGWKDETLNPPFDFRRLGPRTPAILISPWLPRKLDSTVYEHSSLLATVKKLFNLKDFLTERDRHTNSFELLFKGAQLRDDNDTPKTLTPLEADLSSAQWGQLLDSVQTEVMQGVLPHLPDLERHEAAAQLAAGTMTLQQASIFQEKALSNFKTSVIANGGQHPHT
jgi:phospholipase C